MMTIMAFHEVIGINKCRDNMGYCTDDCSQRCSNLHPGATGVCEDEGFQTVHKCFCYYDCTEKICEINGVNMVGCEDAHCVARCILSNIKGLIGGYCYSLGNPKHDSCNCQYYCN